MRLRKNDQKNLLKVGVFLSLLTVVVMVMIMSIGKENSIFDRKIDIRARVANVSALKVGSYVELKGIRIGSVTDISIRSEDEVQITMTILEKQLKWIKQDSKVSISTAGLVGDKFVEIYGGHKETNDFRPRKDILHAEAATDLKKFISKGDTIATITERILAKVDTILLNLEDGKKIVDAVTAISLAAQNLEKMTADMNKANMGQMVKNVNHSMEKLSKSSASLERILDRVEHGPGTANSMIYDEGLHEDLRALLGGAERNKVIKYYIRESIKNSEKKKN